MSKIYTVPVSQPYFEAIAAFVLNKFSGNLHNVTVYLPTRRACRYFQEVITKQSGQFAVWLPKVIPIGEVDLEDIDVEHYLEAPNLVGKLEQRAILTNIILNSPDLKFNIAQASSLAGQLAGIFNDFVVEKIELENINGLVNLDSAEHWVIISKFLNYAYDQWQAKLKEIKKIDHAHLRNHNIEAIINNFRNRKDPVIIAGTTGSIKCVRELFKEIANFDNGYAILPQIDADISDKAWEEVGETDILYHIKRLLKFCEYDRKNLIMLEKGKAISKNEGKYKTLKHLIDNYDTYIPKPEDISHITYLPVDNATSEASVITLLINHIRNNNSGTVALVTHNEELVNNVSLLLKSCGIEMDISFGQNLQNTNEISVIMQLAKAVIDRFSTTSLALLLKNPLLLNKHIFQLELAVFRGREFRGGLKELLLRARSRMEDEAALIYLEDLFSKLSALEQVTNAEFVDFEKFLRLLIETAESLIPTIWQSEVGLQPADFFRELLQSSKIIGLIEKRLFPSILENFLSGIKIHNKLGWNNPVVAINPVEARLMTYDYVIMADLNESSWPGIASPDPWLNNSMRKALSIPTLQENISKSYHDFYIGLSQSKVIITRSIKKSGALNISSRFLQSFLKIVDSFNLQHAIKPTRNWQKLAEDFLNVTVKSSKSEAKNYAICDFKYFPARIAPSNIEQLIRNPYGFYARKVLKLYPLDNIAKPHDVADFGNFIHDAFEYLSRNFSNIKLEDMYSEAIEFAKNYLRSNDFDNFVINLWMPKYQNIIKAFIEFEKLQNENSNLIDVEILGRYKLEIILKNGDTKNIYIEARADRLQKHDGHTAIIDYKTGTVPLKNHVLDGISPQLAIEAAICEHEGFGKSFKSGKYIASFIKVSATKPYLKEVSFEIDENTIKIASQGLKNLLDYYASPEARYYIYPDDRLAPTYDDYKYLARVQE